MSKRGVNIEWSFIENEQDWTPSKPAVDIEQRADAALAVGAVNRIEKRMATLAILLALLLVGGWMWEKQNRVTKTTSELQAAFVQELQAQTVAGSSNKSSAISATGSLAGVASSPAVEVGEFHRLGDRVMVQATVSYPVEEGMLAYRESRFYQKRTEGWQRIDPDPELMGPLQTLETTHFTIHYRAVDASAVYETAPKIEQLYAKLRHDFGVPFAEATARYTIEVVTEGLPRGYRYHLAIGKCLIAISSPSLLSVPVEMTATTVLYQSLLLVLPHLVITEAIDQYQVEWKSHYIGWYPMSNALRLWALWAEGGPLVEGREEVVRWYFERADTRGVQTRSALPDGYVQLCRTYRIWRMAPLHLSIPLHCDDMEGVGVQLPTQDLLELEYPPPQPRQQVNFDKQKITLAEALDSTVASATIIEYIVAVYGQEQLPILLAALGVYKSVDTLIPAVFGVSTSEFEAGWQAYLAEQYHVVLLSKLHSQ